MFSSALIAHEGNVVKENFHYTRFSIADGLPSSEIYEVFQDSKGYLWIGTDKGVSRYNGRYFENFTTKDGIRYIMCELSGDELTYYTRFKLSKFLNDRLS